MRRLILNIGVFTVLAVAMSSCYPGGADYISELDIVYTNYNYEYNFGSINTYYLDDSINHVIAEGKDPTTTFDKHIISELERNLNGLGYTRLFEEDISGGTDPDVAIVATVVEVENYVIYSYPWYPGWGWGWGWGYSSYYWGYYPWYPTYVSSYETGTIHWQLFDPEYNDDINEIVYEEWTGALNGLLGSSTANAKTRITNGIDQAFKQSTYMTGQ